jgi:hypothetical protein
MAIYTDSKGREHIVAEMPFTYLVNAINKLELLDEPDKRELLTEMKAEKVRRDEAYQAQQAAEQGQG